MDPDERNYIIQRIKAELKAAKRAKDPRALLAHRSLAKRYLARLRELEIVSHGERVVESIS